MNDLLTFLARTNPLMFFLVGGLRRRQDDEQYQQLLGAGPYTMGRQGHFLLAVLILLPLVCVLVVAVLTGRL